MQGIFAWLVFPFLGAQLAIPNGSSLLELWSAGGAAGAVIYGILWGIGGLAFGLSTVSYTHLIEVYRRLFYKYEEQKHLIPEGNLVEVKFEDFEQDAFAMTEDIYKKLNLPGFEESKAEIEKYLGKKKGYKKNQYKYDDRTVRRV